MVQKSISMQHNQYNIIANNIGKCHNNVTTASLVGHNNDTNKNFNASIMQNLS